MKTDEIIAAGKRTVLVEGQALLAASQRLGASFASAVTSILSAKGRVVVTGLGKSGHVARKIASTLSSTGTPAFYLHPSEAQHGDFGMLTSEDVLIAIAYGGETEEVVAVANFARRHDVGVIAITGNGRSRLADLAQIVLDGSIEKEACPHNLAPTTSASVALALGDALAIATMEAKGFNEKQFAELHPGGRLGRRLRTSVRDLMRSGEDVRWIHGDAGFHAVLDAVTRNNFGIVGVVDAATRELVGCITDGDVRRALLKHGGAALSMEAQRWMSRSPRTVEVECLAVEAARKMEDARVTALFVVDASVHKPIGILRMHDLLEARVL